VASTNTSGSAPTTLQPDVTRGAFGAELPGEGDREDSFLQLVDDRGTVVAATANVRGMAAAVAPLPPGAEPSFHAVSDVPLSTHRFRVLASPVRSGSGGRTLVVAKNLDDVDETVRILTASLILAIPAVVAVLAFLVWWLTGRVLRPVEAIRSEVANIQGTDLQRRVPVPGSYDEISRLARTMNAMLDRVEHATERQRRFVADASHELRSPLAAIRTRIEVGLAHPDGTDWVGLARSIHREGARLEHLVDDLLVLSRTDGSASAAGGSAGTAGGSSGTVGRGEAEVADLDELVLAEVEAVRARGRVAVKLAPFSAARLPGRPDDLRRLVRNLLDNAERHAAGAVRVSLSTEDGAAELVVADDGEGIPPGDAERVFERFFRLQPARDRDSGGAGLGLAIVRDVATAHGGRAWVAPTAGGAEVHVRLPLGGAGRQAGW
jgi:signal transduction histidine kinase